MHTTYDYVPPSQDSSQVLIVFHGLGATADDLISVVSFAKNYHLYFFQAPDRIMSLFNQIPCPAWFTWEKHFSFTQRNETEMDLIASQIRSVLMQKHDINLIEIHALGFSQGGVMALRMSSRVPLRSVAFLSSFYDQAHIQDLNLKETDLFISHSKSDQVVPSTLSLDFVKRIGDQTGRVMIHSYPHMGHGINAELIKDYEVFLKLYDKSITIS